LRFDQTGNPSPISPAFTLPVSTNGIIAIIFDSQANLYAVTYYGDEPHTGYVMTIYKVTAAQLAQAAPVGSVLVKPTLGRADQMAFDRLGDLCVSGFIDPATVQCFNTETGALAFDYATEFLNSGVQPNGIAFDAANRLIVSQTFVGTVLREPAARTGPLRILTPGLCAAQCNPQGSLFDLAQDSSGFIYVPSWQGANTPDVIYKIDPVSGAATKFIDSHVSGPTQIIFTPGFKSVSESVLYSFKGGSDGAEPLAELVFGCSGGLYGTTTGGRVEPSGPGTVFELTPPIPSVSTEWTEAVLYSFKGTPDGAKPFGRLVFACGDALYGTTRFGGDSPNCPGPDHPPGCGTVFRLTPPVPPATQWTETVVHSFKGPPDDGSEPLGGLTFDESGALYGTTFNGGTQGGGTVFKLTPPVPPATSWTETVLYSFQGPGAALADGANPHGGVVFDASGNLYGTTQFGGMLRACAIGPRPTGTVFKLTPPTSSSTQWTETVLYIFRGGSDDGAQPAGDLIFDSGGALYGTTFLTTACGDPSDKGTVFKLTPPVPPATQWTETLLHEFTGGSNDGANPNDHLILDSAGALYGTTQLGGTPNSGTVFKLTPPVPPATQWTETIVYIFKNVPDGAEPISGLTFDESGALYGTTVLGGTSNSRGTVFRVR
jgi:uncharacterized repeat protein (TIGR03803 family)